jgi:hypothetical protein
MVLVVPCVVVRWPLRDALLYIAPCLFSSHFLFLLTRSGALGTGHTPSKKWNVPLNSTN